MSTDHASTPRGRNRRLAAASAALAVLLVGGMAMAQPRHHYRPTPVHVCAEPGIQIAPGMAPHSLSLPVHGVVPCGEVAGHYCAGYVTPEPTCIHVHHPTEVEIEVTWASTDSVLALTGAGGTFSDDDGGHGTNSRIQTYLAPGDYLLYAGTYRPNDRGNVSIAIGDASWRPEPPRPTPPPPHHGRDDWDDDDRWDPDVPPGHLDPPGRGHGHGRGHGRGDGRGWGVSYEPEPDPAGMCPVGSQVVVLSRWQPTSWVSGVAAGEMDSSDRVGYFAAGWLPASPQVCVVVDEPGHYAFEVTSSPGDTVLALVAVGGFGPALFDDDGGGGWLSRVSGHLDPGVYLLYVGTFGWHDRTPFQLVATRG